MSAGSLIGAIGYAFFGPIGGLFGALIGNALFPPERPSGPRLQIGVTRSEYGGVLPILYGTKELAGTYMAAKTWIVEGDSGGKGGDEPTPDKAYGSFAVALCEGSPDLRLGRIWAGPEKRLIWDGQTFEGGAGLLFHTGAEDQLPDPHLEAFFGAIPAYRGTCYITIGGFPLEKDGNRLPFLTVEVGRIDAQVAQSDLGWVYISNVLITDQYYIAFYYGVNSGVVIRNLSDNGLYKHYSTLLGTWDEFNAANWFFDADRNVLVQFVPNALSYVTMPIATGVPTTHTISAAVGADANLGFFVQSGLYHNGSYIFGAIGSTGAPSRVTLYGMNPDTHAPSFTYATDSSGTFYGPLLAPVGGEPYLYGFSYPQTLKRYALASATAPTDLGQPAPTVINGVAKAAVDPNTGYIWSIYQSAIDSGQVEVHVNNPATQTLVYSEIITTDVVPTDTPWCFVPGTEVHAGNRAIVCGTKPSAGAIDGFLVFGASTLVFVEETYTVYRASAEVMVTAYNPVTDLLMAFRRFGWVSFSDFTNDPSTTNFTELDNPLVQVSDNVYLGQADAAFTPNGQPLDEIVLDLSLRAGLTADQVDVTALADDIVDGYAITDQMSVRDAITALMPVYYFDLVESEGKVKAVKRGGAATIILDEDVGCFEQGSDPADPMETTRRQDVDLPRSLTVKYLLAATNYSVAAKNAKRLIGSSGEDKTMDCALVLSDTKAQEVAEVNLHGAWVARITYKFTLNRKWSHLEPTDVVVVYGYTMRLTKTVQKDGIIECEATAEDAPLYTPHVVVTETPPAGGAVDIPATLVLEIA